MAREVDDNYPVLLKYTQLSGKVLRFEPQNTVSRVSIRPR